MWVLIPFANIKKDLLRGLKNGAVNVVVLEIISHLLKVVKSEEYQWVEFNLQKLIA